MYNIVATTPLHQHIIVENFVEEVDKDKSLLFWKNEGMTNCSYEAVKYRHYDSNKENRAKRDGFLYKTNNEPLKLLK